VAGALSWSDVEPAGRGALGLKEFKAQRMGRGHPGQASSTLATNGLSGIAFALIRST
jgi:hypothetical protein